jgi:hypothetical protein
MFRRATGVTPGVLGISSGMIGILGEHQRKRD